MDRLSPLKDDILNMEFQFPCLHSVIRILKIQTLPSPYPRWATIYKIHFFFLPSKNIENIYWIFFSSIKVLHKVGQAPGSKVWHTPHVLLAVAKPPAMTICYNYIFVSSSRMYFFSTRMWSSHSRGSALPQGLCTFNSLYSVLWVGRSPVPWVVWDKQLVLHSWAFYKVMYKRGGQGSLSLQPSTRKLVWLRARA